MRTAIELDPFPAHYVLSFKNILHLLRRNMRHKRENGLWNLTAIYPSGEGRDQPFVLLDCEPGRGQIPIYTKVSPVYR